MSRQKQTLLILIPGFPAYEEDSTCLPSQQLLVKALNCLFPELQVIILTFQYPYADKEYEWFGNTVIPFNGQNKPKIHRLFLWRKVWTRLRQLKNEYNIVGIFSCWCTECALVGKYFSKQYSLKHFIWICGQDAKKSNHLVKIIRPHPASLIAISDFLVKEFSDNHGILPAHVVPIGIDPSLFPSKTNEIKDIDILGVGSLIPLKRYEIFVDVVRNLIQPMPGIKTLICGDGNEAEKLQTLINKGGLQNNLFLSGKREHSEVLQLMQRSKIFLHPSSYEGLGAVCIEALYAGAHVISFVKPINDIVSHWHIVGNEEQMLQKALTILTDEHIDFSPVMVNPVTKSASLIMQLFGYDKRSLAKA